MRIRGGSSSILSSIVAAALVATGVGVAVATPSVAAEPAPGIGVEKLLTQQVDDPSADTSILIGGSIGYTVRVSNSGAAGVGRAYNVSVRDVLPAGVSYKAGSSSLGDPTVIANAPAAGQTTLIWANLFDVTPAGEQELTYSVTPDPVALPVSSTITNAATAYATNDPFDVTDFSATGTCTSGCSYAASDSVTALVNAIQVRKNEVTSPENELVRGVHDNAAVYSITITNNTYRPTTGVSAIDYIPAGLEFLGCGGVDNTTGDLREWTSPGGSGTQAPRLTVVPAPPSNCIQPTSVDTTTTRPSAVPPGLYTRVLWSLGDLAPGESRTVSYRVGIPLFENTNTWPNGKPLSTELRQAANLDNNLGASTAETGSETSWTNYVNAVGKYQGPNVNGVNPVTINTYNRDTVTAEDLAVDKSVKPSTFSIGGTATYTLRLRTSEYRASTLQTFVDQLPDGLEFDAGSGTGSLTVPSGTSVVPVAIAATSYAAGPQSLTITPTLPRGVLPADATLTVTFTASMKDSYSTGAPTASGDTYTNTVNVSGTTTPVVCPNVPPGPAAASDCSTQPVITGVSDTSSAAIQSGGAVVDKTIGQDPAQTDCSVQKYGDTTPAPPFQVGDIICFELSGALSGGGANNVLSPVIRDFLPDNLAFEPGSDVVVRGGASDTNIPDSAISFVDTAAPTTGGGSLAWILGEVDPQATNPGQLVVTPQGGQGPRFRVRFAARVISAVLDQNKDIKGNLLKASAVDSEGQAIGGRDEVSFEVAGSQVSMLKGVAQVNGLPATPFPPNTDNKQVKGGDVVTFRIDVTNTGLTGAGSDVQVRDLTVVDDLPTGITCARVPAGSISDGGVCSDAAKPSRITWSPAPGVIDPQKAKTLTYDMAIPTGVLVNTNYVNRATVTRYESNSNSGWVTNEPEKVTDVSNVRTANASLTKSGQTSLNLPNNNTPNQFTVGETITYTVDAVVPAGTSLPSGSALTDAIPAGLQYVAGTGSATYSSTGTAGPFGALPGSARFTDGGPTWLSFDSGFANASSTANSVFRLRFTARVLGSTYAHGQEITNTARFFKSGSFDRSSSYSARVVVPNPQIAKANNASAAVNPGAPITYTLTVTNPSPASPSAANPLRPHSYDTVVVDCLPAGLTFGAYGALPPGVTSGTDLGPTCASGTRISWLIGAVPTGTTVGLTYTASVASGTAASTSFTNVATVTGSTLNNALLDPKVEGVYSSTATSAVRTSTGAIAKTVTPLRAPVGSTAAWEIKATYRSDLVFTGASIVDVLPSGVDESSVVPGTLTCTNGGSPCGPDITGQGGFGAFGRTGSTLTWTIGTIPDTAGDVVITVQYTARVKASTPTPRPAGQVLTNTATSRYAACVATAPCPTATSDLIVTRPQLRVGKAVSTPTPAPGETYEYSVIVNNEISPLSSPAYLIRVVDAVPVGVIVDEATVSDGGLITGATATGGGTITWEVAGPLAIGDALTFTYSAKLPSSITSGAYTNTVGIPTYASYPTNGDVYDDVPPAQATVTVGTAKADMAIVKTPNGSTEPGGTWTFTMDVSNVGPSDAEGPISVVDDLPDGLTFASNGPDWNCFPFDQTVFCAYAGPKSDFPSLQPAEHTTPLILSVTIAATPETASYTNVAQVFSVTEDPNPDNDVSRATVAVSPTPIPVPPDPNVPVDPTDPNLPVDPTDRNTPVDPTDPNTPVDPTDPGEPGIAVQKPAEPLPIPDRIEPGKPTVVLPGGIVTNAEQEVTASVQCRPLRSYTGKVALTLDGRWVPLGDVSYCQVRTTSEGKVIVTTTYPGPVLVKVTFSAPATSGYTAFTQVKRYVVVPR